MKKKLLTILFVILALSAVILGTIFSIYHYSFKNNENQKEEKEPIVSSYEDGTILLLKPINTNPGAGGYEAGDIVEIREGKDLLKK